MSVYFICLFSHTSAHNSVVKNFSHKAEDLKVVAEAATFGLAQFPIRLSRKSCPNFPLGIFNICYGLLDFF